jgi:bis(5'-nucleosyl)-tetraphosphatase (symmetrical)
MVMANWAIGDVQGCLGALRRLITAIEAQDAQATFYFCGDLVNRGEDSLGDVQPFVELLGRSPLSVEGFVSYKY